ncbi:MAG TPA: nucleoside deaminase [Bacteroidetes bacterium]|nr:nucleoside deaminase [Bacteroidota bacterium]
MEDHKKYMTEALKEAQKAFDRDEVPIGAIVVCNNTVIARAYNLTESLNDPTAHAEMQAITAATSYLGGKYLNQCTLYVTLEPCSMCAGAIYWSQLGRLVYGAQDPKRGYSSISSKLVHPKTEVISNVLSEEAERLIKDFFISKR